MGGILGGGILQTPKHGGGISNALSQIGTFSPSTHMHSHAAKLFFGSIKKNKINKKILRDNFIKSKLLISSL
jgi:hypothetical protein